MTIEERWRDHVSASTRPNCNAYKRMVVVRAIAKYGPDNFVRSVLEECSTEHSLTEAERRHIRERNTTDRTIGYNLTYGGEGIIPTPETRARMSEAQRGRKHTAESKAKMSAAHLGCTASNETRQKMRDSHLGIPHSEARKKALSTILTGRIRSEKHCASISAARRGRATKHYHVGAFDPNTGVMMASFESAAEANRQSSGRYKRPAICEVCNGKRKSHAGLVWRYLESETGVESESART